MTGKNEFTFPFDTCEKPNDDAFAAQPYSVVVNVISCCVVAYFLWKAKTFHATVLLVGLLLFDLSHTFSHFVHIQSSVQITLVHVLAYVLNFSFLYALYKHTKIQPSASLLVFLFLVLAVDVYAFFHLSLLYYLFTQILFFFSVLFYYYRHLNKTIQNTLHISIFLIGIVYLGFINEIFNCKKMLRAFPEFPFHAIVEIIILFAVYFVCLSFYKL